MNYPDDTKGDVDASGIGNAEWMDQSTAAGSVALADLGRVLVLRKLYSTDADAIGAIIPLTKNPIRLGRGQTLFGHPVKDSRVSRDHARIDFDPKRESHMVHDLRSRNGTFLNGRLVRSERLSVGDVLRVGDIVMDVALLPPAYLGWKPHRDSHLLGRSEALWSLHKDIARVAPTPIDVLVTGDTGTGKEVVAREVHRLSRRVGDLVALNCAAIPGELFESEVFGHVRGAFSGASQAKEGLIRAAEGGTLFLDEIGELSPHHQAKLLRVLQERMVRPVGASNPVPVDVRLIAATNRDLDAAVHQGTFRNDLLARLRGWTLRLQPLTKRRADILPLTTRTLATLEHSPPSVVTAGFFEALLLHSWPGNVRELLQAVKHAAVRCEDETGKVTARDLPASVTTPVDIPISNAKSTVSEVPFGATPTREELVSLLTQYSGRIADVARHSGRQRTQVYRWLRRFELDATDFRNADDPNVTDS
jgi:transcriptional regulator of acetoin/glycerol metabolism